MKHNTEIEAVKRSIADGLLSTELLTRIAACYVACDGIPTEALRSGKLAQILDMPDSNDSQYLNVDCNYCGLYKRITSLRQR
jgi:hypothetical protein